MDMRPLPVSLLARRYLAAASVCRVGAVDRRRSRASGRSRFRAPRSFRWRAASLLRLVALVVAVEDVDMLHRWIRIVPKRVQPRVRPQGEPFYSFILPLKWSVD